MTPVQQVTSLYIGYFGRAPDPAGLNYWVGRLADGFTLPEIAQSFSVQTESTTKYPYLSNPNIASPQAFITQIYLNLFNHLPDAAGLAYWTAELQGGADVGDFILNVISGAVTAPDSTIIENKVEVGVDFALSTANLPGFVYDADAANAAVEVIDGVDETAASVTEAKAETDAYVAGVDSEPGVTIALTNVVENVTGTAGNDTITGVIDPTLLSGTFQTGDVINGGAGSNDVLSLIVANGANIIPAGISNVETIRVQALANSSIDLSNATGIETIEARGGNSSTVFYNVGNIVDAAFTNSNAGLRIDYTAGAVAGLNDVQKVSLIESSAYLEVYGAETLAITATGENGIGLNTDADAITVAGSGDVSFYNTVTLDTFDASASTGDIYAEFNGADHAVTGGAGDDVFDFGTSLDENDAVDGGDGEDTVFLDTSSISNFSAAADAAGLNAIANVERLTFYGNDGVTINGATFTNADVTNLQFSTDGDDIIDNAGSARTYEFADSTVSSNGDATFNMNGTSTTLNIALLGTDVNPLVPDDGDGVDIDDLFVNLSGVQPSGTIATVNIVSSGDLADGDNNDIDTVTAAAGSTFNVTGTGNLDLGDFANRAIINASAFTGDLTVWGSESVIGATAADFVSGSDIITLGAGNDTVIFDSALDSGVGNGSYTGTNAGTILVDIINGFVTGANGDVLDADYSVASDADYTALSSTLQADIDLLAGGAATLRAAADIAASAALGDEWTAFTFQGQTYALYDADAATTAYDDVSDLLVQITGVNVANLTDANFA